MKRIIGLLAIGLLAGWGCAGSKPQPYAPELPIEKRILDLLNHPETKFFYSTDKIPRRLLSRAKSVSEKEGLVYDGIYKMAEPGAPFRHGCVPEEGLLTRRMIFLARRNNTDVLCYERGGRAHNLLISYAEVSGRKMSYYNIGLQGISSCAEYTNLEQIKRALEEGRVSVNYLNGMPTRRHVPF